MKKNLLILFLIAVIIGLAIAISHNHNKYDINNDGTVDEKDLIMMEYYCGKE